MKVQRIESKEIRDVRVHGGGSIDTKYLAKLVFFWSRSVNSTNLALILVTLVKFPKGRQKIFFTYYGSLV